jgi:hypothetical protein
MNTQNILRSYSHKLNISLDSSEYFDFILDTSESIDLALDMSEFYDFKLDTYYDEMDYVDLVLDYSEYYDFELINGFEEQIYDMFEYEPLISFNNKENYEILTIDGFVILTQLGESIQYQY